MRPWVFRCTLIHRTPWHTKQRVQRTFMHSLATVTPSSSTRRAFRPSVATAAAFVVLFVATLLLAPPRAQAAPSLQAYRGAGVWVDIFDNALWASPERQVRRMQADGIRTLYLQTSNSSQQYAIYRPDRTARFLEAAHARGIKVVAWYLPTLANPARDASRSVAAIRFRTPRGHRFDSFALDVEATTVRSASVRNARLLSLSNRIRTAAGSRFPLGAIIPSPRGMEMHPSYWPGFPYRELRRYYDVFVPMVYTTYHVDGAAAARLDTTRALDILRSKAGAPAPPIHLIAGIADRLSGAESLAVVRVAREYGLLGASMYDMQTMGPEDWKALRHSPVNPLQPVPMPMQLGTAGEFGHRAGVGGTHPTDVVYTLPPTNGDVTLAYDAYDLGAAEVSVLVNWKLVATLPPTVAGQWTEAQTVVLPDAAMPAGQSSRVIFTTSAVSNRFPTWGLRGVTTVS